MTGLDILIALVGAAFLAAVVVVIARGYDQRNLSAAHNELRRVSAQLRKATLREAEIRSLLAGALDAVPHPVFVTDRDRIILDANRAALEQVHYTREEVEGRV